MDKYLKLINEAKQNREFAIIFLEQKNIKATNLDIKKDLVEISLDSSNRFNFTLIKEEYAGYLKRRGMRYKIV